MTTDKSEIDITRTLYYQKLADDFFEHENYLPAVDHYRLSLLHDEKNQTSRLGLAQTYIRMNQYDLALTEFNRLVELTDGKISNEAMSLMNFCFEKAGSFAKSYQLNRLHFEKTGSVLSLWKMYEMSMKLKKYDQALETLRWIDQKDISDQKSYLVYLSRAEVHLQQKHYESALNELIRAEQIKPFDELALQKIMRVYTSLEKWREVISTGQKYIKYQKRTLPVSEGIARAAINIEDYSLAITEFQWQATLGDATNSLKLKVAHLNFLMKNFVEAEKQYHDLLDTPLYADEVRYYLSLIYSQTERSRQAYIILDQIEEDSVYYPEAQVKLAEMEYKDQEKTDALNRLRKAHLVRKDSILIYKTYSEYLIDNNNFAEAVALLEKGIINTPSNDILHIHLAFCHYKFRNYKMFKNELARAMDINPTNAKTYEMLSELWYKDNKKSSEVEYFVKMALKLDTQNESLMKILAWVYVDQNKLDKAVALFENLYDERPKDFFYPEMLSKIYYLKNIKSKAVEYATYARNLQDEINIKDYLNKLLKNKNTNYDHTFIEDQRRPASLE